MALSLVSEYRCHGGTVGFYRHASSTCNSEMRFSVFVPPQARSQLLPVLYFLSGLTCTEENFMVKAGAQRYAAELGLMLVVPDTSPRNTGIPGEDQDWDFGTGAGFYVDATQAPWCSHYRMYSYVTKELPELIAANFPARRDRQGLCGHSMGGHGALVCALRNPDRYRSVSALAPICAPTRCPWGEKAFAQYLGPDRETWKDYDASELIRRGKTEFHILVDQGGADPFLETQLMPEALKSACDRLRPVGAQRTAGKDHRVGQALTLRMHEGYDHSYYFISTFIGDHLRHHAEVLLD